MAKRKKDKTTNNYKPCQYQSTDYWAKDSHIYISYMGL
jgi:hypothetical protein